MRTSLQAKSLMQRLSQRLNRERIMSRHPSYGKPNKAGKKQNVLKRFQRIDILKKLGRWKDGENKKVTGLPKTPVVK